MEKSQIELGPPDTSAGGTFCAVENYASRPPIKPQAGPSVLDGVPQQARDRSRAEIRRTEMLAKSPLRGLFSNTA